MGSLERFKAILNISLPTMPWVMSSPWRRRRLESFIGLCCAIGGGYQASHFLGTSLRIEGGLCGLYQSIPADPESKLRRARMIFFSRRNDPPSTAVWRGLFGE